MRGGLSHIEFGRAGPGDRKLRPRMGIIKKYGFTIILSEDRRRPISRFVVDILVYRTHTLCRHATRESMQPHEAEGGWGGEGWSSQ